jgi:hypothetical protein
MALIVCPDCRKEISEKAPACPNCGRPMTSTPTNVEEVNARGFIGKPGTGAHIMNIGCAAIIIGVFLLIVLMYILR